jgi:hypothetical protein
MARRYPTAKSYEQLVVSRVVSSLGIGILALIAFMWSRDRDATLLKAAPFGLVGLTLLVGAQVYAARNSQYLRVDINTRQAVFVARGKERWKASIDELAPIVCTTFERRRQRNSRSEELTEYQAVLSGHKEVALRQTADYPASRRWAVRLARNWGIGLRGLDGRVRAASELDHPLRPAKEKPPPLSPDAGVSLSVNDGVATLRSSVLPRSSDSPDLYLLAAAAFLYAVLRERHADQVFLDPFFRPLETALLGAVALVAVGVLAVFLRQVWRFLQPATLQVDAQTVRYRGRSMAVRDVREVVSVGDILILGNDRHIAIPSDFCRPRDAGVVVRAIHQLIAERAAARGHATFAA